MTATRVPCPTPACAHLQGYVSSEDSSVSSSVPGLGFLIGTTGALLGTAAYVVLATSH